MKQKQPGMPGECRKVCRRGCRPPSVPDKPGDKKAGRRRKRSKPGMELGDYRIEIIPDTEFRLDGGAMFGVVPRVLWERVCPPDELNRIRMNMNCLFIETPSERRSGRDRYRRKMEREGNADVRHLSEKSRLPIRFMRSPAAGPTTSRSSSTPTSISTTPAETRSSVRDGAAGASVSKCPLFCLSERI